MGLNVSEFNQMYEILGRPLSDPIACETHGASQERQTVPNVSAYSGLPISRATGCLEKLPL